MRLPVLRRLAKYRVAPTVNAMNPSTKCMYGKKRSRALGFTPVSMPGRAIQRSRMPVAIHPVTFGKRRRANSSPPTIPITNTVAMFSSGSSR